MSGADSPFTPRDFGGAPSSGNPGAVVLHGFTGAPSDVWPVAQALGSAGFATHVPCLRGHDGGVAGIREATLEHWRADVLAAATSIYEATGEPVFVAGLSMGALLAMDLALAGQVPLCGLGILAPPLALEGAARTLSGLVHRIPSLRNVFMPKFRGPDISNGAPLPGANGAPLLAVHELFRLMDHVKERLAQLSLPLLILHARADHTAPIIGGYMLAATAPASPMRFVVMEHGFHVITRDVESTRVAREVVAFAQRVTAAT